MRKLHHLPRINIQIYIFIFIYVYVYVCVYIHIPNPCDPSFFLSLHFFPYARRFRSHTSHGNTMLPDSCSVPLRSSPDFSSWQEHGAAYLVIVIRWVARFVNSPAERTASLLARCSDVHRRKRNVWQLRSKKSARRKRIGSRFGGSQVTGPVLTFKRKVRLTIVR